MSVNASRANSSGQREPNPDDDAAWLARLNDVFARWASWAAESNARSSACFRQMFADRWIELTLAERVLEDVRTASAESRASRARQARAWTLRCIERMTTSVAQVAASKTGCTTAYVSKLRTEERMTVPRFEFAAWAEFCAREVATRAGETDRAQTVSDDVWHGICEHGYLQLFHAAAEQDLYPAMYALAKSCAATYWKATISLALCGRLLRELAPGPISQRWIARLVTGQSLGCFAATERGSGSDPASYRSTLSRRLRIDAIVAAIRGWARVHRSLAQRHERSAPAAASCTDHNRQRNHRQASLRTVFDRRAF